MAATAVFVPAVTVRSALEPRLELTSSLETVLGLQQRGPRLFYVPAVENGFARTTIGKAEAARRGTKLANLSSVEP